MVNGDSFWGSFTLVFSSADVGSSKLVTISSSYSGNDLGNYSITGQSSVGADINKASPTISGLSAQSKYSDDADYILTGSPSITGLSLSYSSSDTNIATANASSAEVSILAIGSTTITASISGTTNYNAATATYILTVTQRPASSGSPGQVATDSAIRSMGENTNSTATLGSTNGNGNNISNLGANVSSSKMGIISSKAKVIILRPNSIPKTEGIYEYQNSNEESTLSEPENSSEDFQKLGQVIGITEYLIEVNSLEKTYNYMLEIRDGGILIKPKNLDSFGYIELNKTIVIDKAMGVVLEDFGIPSFQIKTIVIDLLSNIAKN